MFTDLHGFTSLSQKDESSALQLLEEHRALVRPLFKKFHGREIKTIGDAFLVEFVSALEAANCACEMQLQLHDLNSTRPHERRILMRIGLHLGEVVHREGDVLGDAVNVASRIEAFAEPGGICLSEEVFRQLKNKFRFPVKSLGSKQLKNVTDPIEVYKVVLEWEAEGGPKLSTMNNRRIAILPFANISPDPRDEYFADGLTDEMIHVLSQVRELEVIARTSVMRYKNSEKQIKIIGQELSAGSILEGTVRKSGNKIRVTAQLVNSTAEIHEWSGSYDRDLDDIFSIQSDLAKQIASVLQVKLLKNETVRVEKKPTENVDAYSLYLMAEQKIHDRTPTAIRESMKLLEHAIVLDPEFARAYATLSGCYSLLLDYGQEQADIALAKAREYAREALKIDPNLAEAHASLALSFDHDYDTVNAEKEFRTAISLNPNYATAHHWYAVSLTGTGKYLEAIEEMKKARAADPLSPIILTILGTACFQAGKHSEAWKQWEETLKVEPDFFVLYLWRALYLIKFERYEEAKKELKRGLTFSPGHSRLLGVLGYTLGVNNEAEAAGKILRDLLDKRRQGFVAGEAIAFVYSGLGKKEEFFDWLAVAVKEKTVSHYMLRSLSLFDSFRLEPQYNILLKEANII